jgi:hypothetical protein
VLVREAQAWMTAQGVADPDALIRVFVPDLG